MQYLLIQESSEITEVNATVVRTNINIPTTSTQQIENNTQRLENIWTIDNSEKNTLCLDKDNLFPEEKFFVLLIFQQIR